MNVTFDIVISGHSNLPKFKSPALRIFGVLCVAQILRYLVCFPVDAINVIRSNVHRGSPFINLHETQGSTDVPMWFLCNVRIIVLVWDMHQYNTKHSHKHFSPVYDIRLLHIEDASVCLWRFNTENSRNPCVFATTECSGIDVYHMEPIHDFIYGRYVLHTVFQKQPTQLYMSKALHIGKYIVVTKILENIDILQNQDISKHTYTWLTLLNRAQGGKKIEN